jgi:ATP/maltotriose-dependent transcriptional regulator MalT
MDETVTETRGSVPAGGADARPALADIGGRPRPLNGRVIRRNRLLRRLDAAADAKLIVVACPAGYGKSTLLADWAASRGEHAPVAWLSVNEADNDPVVFWAHLGRALRQVCPGLGDAVADEITAPALIMDRVLPRLVSALAGQPAMTPGTGRRPRARARGVT